jgi:putative nucleotidyltransferase with HDIG domain
MDEHSTDINIFTSRLGRRIFATFVACALVPVVALAVLSLYQVSHQLEEQAYQRLRRAARNHGLSIFEHLLFCEDELKLVGVRSGRDIAQQQNKFEAIGRRYADGRYEALFGDPIMNLPLTARQREHLEDGNTLAVITNRGDVHITLVRYVDIGADTPGLLMGTVRGDYLWGLEGGNNLPPLTEFAVLSDTGLPLFRSPGWPKTPADLQAQVAHRQYRVNLGGNRWFAADGLIFLQSRFETDSWSVMVLQPEADILAPIARFKLIFVLVVILALMLVVALSLFNLRRSLGPIEALKNGARCIARREFDHRVEVTSKDEFLELARSFNDMSGQLGQQFQFLATQARIDQATLMARDFNHIAGLSITRVLKDFPFQMVAIGRVNVNDPDDALVYVGHRNFPEAVTSQPFHVQDKDLMPFNRDLPWMIISERELLGSFLPEKLRRDFGSLTFFPVFIKDRLYALLIVAGHPASLQMEGTLPLMRQIADHLAVVWSNVNLIRDLRRLTIGSMQALARAVDAKSSWTAGHSARVMRIALGIARHMGFGEERIDRLQQAALLHDIGKIGIRSGILDKPGKLTDEEFAAIREHPVIGDKILSPIEAFREIIPMVRQHHERWDGKGYPDGLTGEAIILEARILAVADVYDAMASDRPYRKGMDLAKVISIIGSEAGRQFDPNVVAVFMELMEEKAELAA